MKIKTFILTFLLMMMSSPLVFGQGQTRVRNFGELRDAIERGDEKIQLSNEINVSEGLIVQSDYEITLDLNGWGLNAAQGTYVITNLGTLTIEDGFDGQGFITGRGILNGNSTAPEASLTINSGIYRGIANAGAAVYNDYGTVKINGGEFYGKQAAIVNKGTMNIECDPLNEEVLIDGEGVNNLAIINIGTLDIKGAAVIIGKREISVDERDGSTLTVDTNVIFAEAKIEKGGNITYYKSLADAFTAAQNNDNVEILCAGVYALSTTGKNITITGLSDGIVFDNIGAKNMGGANVTFTNVTFDYYPNALYTGLQHSGNLVYNNCTFEGQPFLYGISETFNNCTFNQNSSDAYNVWTYGAEEVAFNECTFNSAGKSVLIYSEAATLVNDVNVTKCTFKASTPVEGKAAIEMDSSLTAGINLTIDGETTAQGFAPGSVSENSLWNNKKGNQGANNDITVVVDDEIVLEPYYSVELNGTKYETLQDAINACVVGDNVITLLDNNTEASVEIDQVEGKNIFIDGGETTRYDFVGTIYIHGNARFTGAEKLTIKNIEFNNKNLTANHDYISSDETDSHRRYAHNVTIENCDFIAPAGTEYDVVAMRFRQSYNIDVIDCEFTNLHSVMWTTGTSGVEFDKITATACKNGMHIGGGSNGVVVENSSLDVENYGIRAEGSGKDFTIENSTIDADIPVVVRKVTDGTTTNFTFKGENTMTQNNPHNYWFVAGTGDKEYEGGEDLPTTAGQVIVNLSGSNLDYDGVYGNYYVAEIDGVKYTTIVEALNAVKKDQIIKIVDNAKGDESTEIVTVETDGRFKMDGNAPEYKFPKIILKNEMDIVSINTNEHKTNLNNLNIDVQAGHLRINNSNVDGIFTVATNMSLANSYLNGTITNNGRINVSGTSNINSAERIVGSGKFYMNAVEMDDRTNMKFANVVFEGSAAERVNNLKGSNIQNTIFTVQNNTIVNVTDNAYIAGPINQADGASNHHVVEGKLNIVNSAAKFNLLDVATTGYLRVEGTHTHEDYYLYGNTLYVNHDIVNEGTIEFVETNVSTNNLILSSGITVGDESVLKVRNNMNINGAELTINGNVTAANTVVEGDVTINMNVEGAKFATPNEIEGIVLNCGADGCKIVYYENAYQVVKKNFEYLDIVMIEETGVGYPTFAEALANVKEGETIKIRTDAEGNESETEIEFTKDIEFTITGIAPGYALPIITFQNATVNIENAQILIPELDARQNATINVIDSKVYDAGGNSIAKSYYNGALNISGDSEVYMMQVTTMGYINISGNAKLHATWQTNVYGNGLVTIKDNATFNTAALHLTAQDYSGRDNTDEERVGKPAEILVDGANLTVGKVIASNDADYSYNSSKGINVGTVEGKSAILNIKNGGNVNIYMANGETANIGAGGTVNIAASTLNTFCRAENGTVTLANNGTVYVTGAANLAAANVTGAGWFYMNGVDLDADTKLSGAKVGFINGVNTIAGSTIKDGWFNVGIGKDAEAENAQIFATANDITLGNVTVNVSENANIDGNGQTYSGWVGSAYSADKTQHTYTLNVTNSLAAFGYMHVSKDGTMYIDGRSADDNRYTYDNANVNFYAGDLIVNGNVKINDADAWVKYTYMSPDHVGGVLDITGTTNYESSIHNGAATGTSLKFYQAGEVNIGKDSKVEIDNKTILVEGSEFNTSGTVTAKGTITNNGNINVLAGTMTAEGTITNNDAINVEAGIMTAKGTITNDGAINVKAGTMTAEGTIANNGTVTVDEGAKLEANTYNNGSNVNLLAETTVDGNLVIINKLNNYAEIVGDGKVTSYVDLNNYNTIGDESSAMTLSCVGIDNVYYNDDITDITGNIQVRNISSDVFVNYGIVKVSKELVTDQFKNYNEVYVSGNESVVNIDQDVTGDGTFYLTDVKLTNTSKLNKANIEFNGTNTLTNADLTDSEVTVNSSAALTVSAGLDNNIEVASLTNQGTLTVNGTLTATTSLSNAANAKIEGSGNIGVDASNVTVLTNEGKINDDLTISVYTINNYNEIEVDKIVSTNFENYSGWVTVDNADLYSNYFRNAATVNVLGEGSSVIIDNIDNTAIGKFNMTNVNLTKPVEVGGSYESGYKLNGANIELLGENTADGIEFSNSTDVNVIGKLTISNAVAVDGVVETSEVVDQETGVTTTGEIILNEGAKFKTTNNSLNVTTEVVGQHPMYDSEEGWYELHSNELYVANIKGTSNYYETLQSAVDAAAEGQTVVIMKNVTEDVTVAKNIYFETETIEEQIEAVTVTGTLTVEADKVVSFNNANVTFNSTRVGANVELNINNSIYNVTTLFTDGTYAVVNVDAESTLNASEKIQFGYSYCTLNIGGTVVTNKFNVPEAHTIVLNQLSATLTTTNNALKVSLPTEDQFADYKVAYVDGAYKVVGKEYIAQVGESRFETIAEAVQAAQVNGEEVVLTANAINETVTINDPVTITTTLNSQIVVNGSLTVKANVTFENVNIKFNSTNVVATLNILGSTYVANTFTTGATYAIVNVGEESVLEVEQKLQFSYSNCTMNIAGSVVADSQFNVPEAHTIVLDHHDATLTTTNSALNVSTSLTDDHKVSYKNGKYQLVGKFVAQIDDVKYETLADALVAVPSNGTIELLWEEGNDPIVMAGILTGKNATIKQAVSTDEIDVDWSKGWLFIARGAEYNNGPSKLTFEGVNLYSVNDGVGTDNNRYGINVSAKRKNTENYNGTLVIKDSYVELSYLYNAYEATFDNSTVTLVNANGMNVGGLLGAYTTTGQAGTATLNIENGTTFNVTNITIGYDGIGIMNVDATSVVNTKPQYGLNVIEGGYLNTYGNFDGYSQFNLVDDGIVNVYSGLYSFDVNVYCVEGVAAFELPNGYWEVRETHGTQTRELAEAGWYWFSSYISDLEGTTGLQLLQSELNPNGKQIKGQFAFTNYFGSKWSTGGLQSVTTAQMYMLNTKAPVTLDFEGEFVDYSNTPIVLNPGWNWIGFPVRYAQTVEVALANLQPKHGDIIKGKQGSSTYYVTDEFEGWFPDLILEPGHGHMYYSTSDETVTFVFNSNGQPAESKRATAAMHWNVNETAYPSNMTMIATTDIEGGDYEVAAFVNGEVRGSARPIYVEALDAYVLVLTIQGNDVEEMTFRYYDITTGEEMSFSNRINYTNDAIIGSMAEPYKLTRGTTGIGEVALSDVNIYPNPTTTGVQVNLDATCEKVEIFNALGVKVAEYQNVDSIDAFETAGIYVIRLTNGGEIKHTRLVVR